MTRRLPVILFLLAGTVVPLRAQIVSDLNDESRLYAQSKQVNQFFRRFNGEEDEKGKRYYAGDKQYRSTKLRKKFFSVLFDESNPGMSPELKLDFAKYVLDKGDAALLDFHNPGWFAEVNCTFLVNEKPQRVTLFMELEDDHLGSKWVISRIHASVFDPYFVRDTTRIGRFLHPMSHELEFMNLRKAFANSDSLSQFTVKRYVPDQLALFLYELKRGNLKFQSVEDVRFHFFQINGWYFQLAQFIRPGYNTGWLIAGLVKLNSENEKDLLRKHLYYEPQ